MIGEICVGILLGPCLLLVLGAQWHAAVFPAAIRLGIETLGTIGLVLPMFQIGLRIEAECFNRSIHQPETLEGLRRFRERDHPDLRSDIPAQTPGLTRD
nr:hypothetical protein [Pseudomonas chlororaphis]